MLAAIWDWNLARQHSVAQAGNNGGLLPLGNVPPFPHSILFLPVRARAERPQICGTPGCRMGWLKASTWLCSLKLGTSGSRAGAILNQSVRNLHSKG